MDHGEDYREDHGGDYSAPVQGTGGSPAMKEMETAGPERFAGLTAAPAPMPRRRDARGAARTAGGALVNWWRAVTIEGLCVGAMWWLGLWLIHVPFAPLWALIAAVMSLVPNFGGVISVIGPVFSVLLSGHDIDRLGLVLGLYAVIVVVDQLVIQPLLLHRVTRVPIWASILVPIALGVVIPFWGVLLGPPLLAVVYAFRKPKQEKS